MEPGTRLFPTHLHNEAVVAVASDAGSRPNLRVLKY